MNAETERKDGARPSHPLRIEGELTIYQAGELKQTLQAALQQGDALEIDLSAVGEIDTAGVQLLIAAKKSAQAAGKELRLVAHSDAVVEAFELLDLGGYFGDPLVMAAQPASHSN
ncbi:MAG TPA: STAS domain-containing protein [Noviherbaspirillum sp.]|nr:STAS domain-containing protein [Noviherbaspirillum sp.]